MDNNTPQAQIFTPEDLSPSRRGAFSHPSFRGWSASAANLALAQWRDGEPVASIFASLGASRRTFAGETGDHQNAERFGRPRTRESITHLTLGHSLFIDRANRDLNRFFPGDLRYAVPPGFSAPRLTRETRYVLADGRVLGATRLGRYLARVSIAPYSFEAGTLVLENTAQDLLTAFIDESLGTLETLRSGRFSNEHKVRRVFHAMYGYFQAMPYERGSAAIGRIAFAALAFAVAE